MFVLWQTSPPHTRSSDFIVWVWAQLQDLRSFRVESFLYLQFCACADFSQHQYGAMGIVVPIASTPQESLMVIHITGFNAKGNEMPCRGAILQYACAPSSDKWIWWHFYTGVIYRLDHLVTGSRWRRSHSISTMTWCLVPFLRELGYVHNPETIYFISTVLVKW